MLGWPFKLIKALAFIHKKASLSQEDFEEYYEKHHAPLAQSLLTFESFMAPPRILVQLVFLNMNQKNHWVYWLNKWPQLQGILLEKMSLTS